MALCLILIIASVLGTNGVLFWQFQRVRSQAEHLHAIDQKLITVLRAHTSLIRFYDRLDRLVRSEDAAYLVDEAESVRAALRQDAERTRASLDRLPPEVRLDPTMVSTLEAIQSALPPQLDAITALATAGDWAAVRLRLANEVRPLESLTSGLAESVGREVAEEQDLALMDIGRARRRIQLVVPLTVLLTLIVAASFGLAVTRSITEPLGRLVESSKALARGDLQHQVRVDGKDELAHLGGVFNETTARLRELDHVRTELAHVARVATLGELTASIAHEVNQPLSGIMTNAGTCLRLLAVDPPDLEQVGETARRTLRDSQRAAEVIARLRALFRKEANAREPFDMNSAIQEVLVLTRHQMAKRKIALRKHLAVALPQVVGDRVQVQQVVLNLILNATDAMHSIDDRRRELIIVTERDGVDGVRIAVRDAGVGLEPDAADRIFEPFYTTKHDGMGIGLSVARSIVESHGGRLWAASNDGPGATVSFTLPCDKLLPTRLPALITDLVDRETPSSPIGLR